MGRPIQLVVPMGGLEQGTAVRADMSRITAHDECTQIFSSQCCIAVRKSPRAYAAIGLQLLRERTGPRDRRLGTEEWYGTHRHGSRAISCTARGALRGVKLGILSSRGKTMLISAILREKKQRLEVASGVGSRHLSVSSRVSNR